MKSEFVTYKIALRMKALGFDEPCITFYPVNLSQPLFGDYATLGLNGKYSSVKDGYINSACLNELWKKRYKQDYANVTAPTWQSAFTWLIPKQDKFKVSLGEWGWSVYSLEGEEFKGNLALEKLIEIVELKQ